MSNKNKNTEKSKYEVDIQVNNNWKFLCETENLDYVDKVVYRVNKQGITCRVIQDNMFLCFVHNNEHSYWFFKNKYIRNKGLDFDYTKSYYDYCKKKEKKD